MIKYLALGFFVKIITGFDDTLTNMPVLASVAKTWMGKVAFSIGTFIAIILAIILALFFSAILHSFPYYRYIAAGLIFALALAIHFDILVHKPRSKAEKKLVKMENISALRFTKLVIIGFIASFASVLDDIIAYSPLFLVGFTSTVYAIIGILIATSLEVMVIIYFATKIAKIKYKEEIAVAGLVALGIMILCGVI